MANQPIITGEVTSEVPASSGYIDFENLIPFVLTKFLEVLGAALIIITGIFLIRYLKRYLARLQIEHEQQKTAINLLEKITTGFIIVISLTLALKVVGIDMTLLVSVSILGLSYGLQDIIKNYVAGILILFKAPFHIGDTIKIKNYTGKVEKMDFQSTTLRTFDRRHVTIYNSDVMTQSIENYSRSEIRRIELDVTLGYGSNIQDAFRIFNQLLQNHPIILKSPTYKIIFKKFTDSGIKFSLKGWIKMPANLLAIKSDLAFQIHQAFDEQNIFMPYSKGVELDTDYSLTENRKKWIANFQNATQLNPQPALDPNFIPENIDFEEIE